MLRQLRGDDQAVVGVAWPLQTKPISLATLWGTDGPEFVGEFCRSKLSPERAVEGLKKAGLQVHEEEVSGDGWQICAGGRFGPALHRAWKVRLALRELLRRGRSTSKQLERLLGHCVFISLRRR